MLWVALHLPELSLDIIERSHRQAVQIMQSAIDQPEDQSNRQPTDAPLAICDRLSILTVNASARDGGLHPGMKRATAQALLPDVSLLDYDPVREQHALRSLACWVLQFTPATGFGPPSLPIHKAHPRNTAPGSEAPLPQPGQAGLLLEVEASLRYFGGLQKLLQHIETDLQSMGYTVAYGLAPTPTAAWLLARHYQYRTLDTLPTSHLEQSQDTNALPARLNALPVTTLIHAQQHETALTAIGANTIGELLELPRAGLARRFGKPLLLEVDCALASQAQPIGFFEAPEQFHSKLELLADVEQADALLFAATRLLIELTGWLRARQAAVRSFDLLAYHEEPPATSMTVRLTDPSRETDRLAGLLRERLNVLQLRAPVHTIELRCDRIQSLAQPSSELFASPTSTQESLGRLLERLQVRLGREQVQRLYLAEDHRPEAAYHVRVVDSLEQLGKPPTARAPSGDAIDNTMIANACAIPSVPATFFASDTGNLPRPLWLLRKPQALRERNNRPWLHSALNMIAGPERIETGWWDTNLVQRDYFVAEDEAHTLYWIYRERQSQEGGGWYVQGRFG